MVNYNFSYDDGLNYQNLPFNQTQGTQGYESSVCIIPQMQDQALQLDSIEVTLLYLAFCITLTTALQVLSYLKRNRMTNNG